MSLIQLDLSNYNLTDVHIDEIVSWLNHEIHHEFELNLFNNKIGNAGVQALAQCRNIVGLNLSRNGFTFPGLQALAVNTTITSLNVSGNGIGAAQAQV